LQPTIARGRSRSGALAPSKIAGATRANLLAGLARAYRVATLAAALFRSTATPGPRQP
jgi:hypothetical protein